jgi:hypothetical protein
MVALHRSRNWKIEIFGREHGIAHVHVTGPDFRATINIESGEIIAGSLPNTVLKEVRLWLDGNRKLALKLWKERNPNL